MDRRRSPRPRGGGAGAVGSHITHIFYCGFVPAPSWAEHSAPNLALLVNSVEPIARTSPCLRHVQLIEGTKIYGSHLGLCRTPAKETDRPHMPPNVYYEQEQWQMFLDLFRGFRDMQLVP